MNRYQLAKLVEWSGESLKTRKRLQKVVYLLQAAGCPLDAEFTLHHYGPYSHDVAKLTDEMVQALLLDESAEPTPAGGLMFSYKLSDPARQQMGRFADQENALERFEQLAKQLLSVRSLQKLEFGATVAYFHNQGKPWNEARLSAAKFKKQDPDGHAMTDAERFARQIVQSERAA